jgi:hypothetical protein
VRHLALVLLLLALPACKGCPPSAPPVEEEWPPGGRQGLLDGCMSGMQPRSLCECLAKRIPEQISWKDFKQHQEDQAANRDVNPATQDALDRVTNECTVAK